jgi:hypothetical protein
VREAFVTVQYPEPSVVSVGDGDEGGGNDGGGDTGP